MVLILGSNRFPMAIHPPSPLYIGAKPSVKYWLILVLDPPHRHPTIIKFADLISVLDGLYSQICQSLGIWANALIRGALLLVFHAPRIP